MKFCIPRLKRRSGLGNELIPWAKAFIAAAELDLTLIDPVWNHNPRGYLRLFQQRPFTRLWHVLLPKLLPTYVFTRADYLATGEHDFGSAIRAYAEQNGLRRRRHYVLIVEGMWAPRKPLRHARPYLLAALYGTRHLARNLYELGKRLDERQLVIAVHIRRGDFKPPQPDTNYVEEMNTALPMEWFVVVCRSLRARLGAENVQFLLFSDGTPDDLRLFTDVFQPTTTAHQSHTDVSDLLAMSGADLLVCSRSWYSRWALLMADIPYLWFRPALDQADNRLFIRSGIPNPPQPLREPVTPRGVPVGMDGALPDYLIGYLRYRLGMKAAATDLVMGGRVPADGFQNGEAS